MGSERQKDHIEQGPIVYWAATIWALVGGCVIISDAFRQRAQLKQKQKTQEKQLETGVKQRDLDVIELS